MFNLFIQAHECTSLKRIVGIELNEYFASLSKRMCKVHSFPRIEIMQGDIVNNGHIVKDSNIVIMNNVLQFFTDDMGKRAVWKTMMDQCQPGTIIISVPDIESQIEDAKVRRGPERHSALFILIFFFRFSLFLFYLIFLCKSIVQRTYFVSLSLFFFHR